MVDSEETKAGARLARANYGRGKLSFEKCGKLGGWQTRGTRARGNLEALQIQS